MKKLLNRKEALGMIDAIFTSLHFNLISLKDLGIENSKERDYFLAEAWKIDQGRLKKDYEQTVNSLDAIGFKEYYKLIGKFATKYKIGCWKEYNEYEPILVEELNEELRKYDKTEDKLELINSFTVDELQSESFIFDSKVQVLYDILDDFNVGNKKEEGINTVLESFNSSDKASFISKLQTDKNLLNALIDKVNGTQKDEMFSLLGEMFICSGFITSQKQTLLGNEANDPISASFYKGDVNIILHSSLPSCSGIKKCITVSPFEIIGMNYDGREIQVPAFLLLNSWSNTFAEPEGIFFNYKHEDIDWNSLDEKQKDEYFEEFVRHYMGMAFFNELIGNPLGLIFTTIVGILLMYLAVIPAAVMAIVGAGLAGVNIYVGSQMLISALEVKKNARNMHEYKKAAKLFAESITKIGINVLWLIISLVQTGKAIYNGKKISIEENPPVKRIEKQAEVKFKIKEKFDIVEYNRQLKNQEDGLNKFTIQEYLDNIKEYKANGRGTEAAKVQKQVRNVEKAKKISELRRNGCSSEKAEMLAEEWIKTQAALHNPDMSVGGNPLDVTGVGDAKINSSIGSQWGNGNAELLETQIRDSIKSIEPKDYTSTLLNVKLTTE